MPTVTQTRNFPAPRAQGRYWINGKPAAAELVDRDVTSQTTTSFRGSESSDRELETGRQLRGRLRSEYKRRFDTGHDFNTTKTTIDWAWRQTPARLVGAWTTGSGRCDELIYVGDLNPRGNPATTTIARWPGHQTLSVASKEANGRKLMADALPTTPEVSLAVMLGELMQMMPKAVGQTLHSDGIRGRSVGGEYLNYQFGLAPLGSDIGKLAYNVTQVERLVAQFRRDSDKIIRRRRNLAQEEVNVKVGDTTQWFALPRCNLTSVDSFIYETSLSTACQVYDNHVTDVWFSGAFQYHLAEAHNFLGKVGHYAQLANQLLGSKITIDTVYQLTPWSWLFDWFWDFDEFIANVTALSEDSLVLRYGYVMHQQVSTRTWNVGNIRYKPAYKATSGVNAGRTIVPTGPTGTYAVATRVTKDRLRSTPYGFGLKVDDFSPRKWAILGALGLTKGDRRLGN